MKPIYIFTLHNVRTGGPEACHQLSDALIEQGFDARTVYYDLGQIRDVMRVPHAERSKQGGLAFGLRENTIPEFERYKTKPVAGAPDREGAIVVLPESIANLAAFYTKATVLVWWLSVDNAFGAFALGDGRDEKGPLYGGINLNLLRRGNVWHAEQSDYAGDALRALVLRSAGRLTDYTIDLPTNGALPMLQRPLRVAVQAAEHKVVAPIDEIARLLRAGGIECVFIGRQTLSRDEVTRLFWTSRVYLDLGNMPGDDRMPREARMLGCQVLVAAETEWEEPEIVASEVSRMVCRPDESVTAHRPAPHGGDPNSRRMTLHESEKRAFFREARDVFNAL